MSNTDDDGVDEEVTGESDSDGWRRMSMTSNEGVSKR
jgi:hypothetical protein